MSERTPSNHETREWVSKLKKRGKTRFMFRELPAKLKDKKLLHKASDMNLISIASKDHYNVATWVVNN